MKPLLKFFLSVWMMCAVLPTFADTLTVTNRNNDGPGSLRFTCMNAKAGDVVIFAPQLSGQTITLLSAIEPSATVTVDGSALADTLTITADQKSSAFVRPDTNCKYIRLKFYQCRTAVKGGKVYHCSFINNSGGGVENGIAYNCTFFNNSSLPTGGALKNGNAYDCVFINNSSQDGGAASGRLFFRCTFIGNRATAAGGAVQGGSAYHCIFRGNKAQSGGAVNMCDAYNCLFTENTASSNGGAMYLGNAYGCSFTKNTASTGGAVGFMRLGETKNCTFMNNSASYGGAVKGGSAFNCTFINNTANKNGGATDETKIYHCTVINNLAENGGGVSGGRCFNSIISNNTATKSGTDLFGTIESLGGNIIGKADSSKVWRKDDRVGTVAAPLDPMLGDTLRCANDQLYFTLKPGSSALNFGKDTIILRFGWDTVFCKDICGNPRPNKCIDAGSFQQTQCMHIQLLGGCKPTSLPEAAVKQPFSLYPNPAGSGFTLRLASEPQNLTAEVFDLIGRKLLFQTLTEKETEMNLDHLLPGVYIIKAGNFGTKLIKE